MRTRESFAAAGLLTLLLACVQSEPRYPGYCYDEELLKAKYAACVATSPTRESSDSCADTVDFACGWTVTRTKVKR